MQIQDEKFTYLDGNRRHATCHVRIIRREGREEAVVIVSALAENNGASPCNAFEELAPQLVDYFQLSPRRLTYFERWGSFSYEDLEREEEFSVVTFSYDPKGRNAFVPGLGRFAHPTWKRVTRAEVEEIAGGELPPFPHRQSE